MPASLYNVKNGVPAQIRQDQQIMLLDGPIVIPFSGNVIITKASAIAATLAAPSIAEDGNILRIFNTIAAVHVITSPVRGFNKKGSSGTLTWASAIGNGATLAAYNGDWYVISNIGVTVA